MLSAVATQDEIDVGLRTYMNKVYFTMAGGIGLTLIIALLISQTPPLAALVFDTPLKWVALLAPLGIVFFMSFKIETMSHQTARTMFWVFSALMGVSSSTWFLFYEMMSVATIFLATTTAYAGLSLYGYTTKKDLSGIGAACFIGLIGLIIAMVVNIFLASPIMMFVTSVIGVLIFAGLTAYDTQNVKNMYLDSDSLEIAEKKVTMGALSFYLNFINLFQFLLSLFGQTNED